DPPGYADAQRRNANPDPGNRRCLTGRRGFRLGDGLRGGLGNGGRGRGRGWSWSWSWRRPRHHRPKDRRNQLQPALAIQRPDRERIQAAVLTPDPGVADLLSAPG